MSSLGISASCTSAGRGSVGRKIGWSIDGVFVRAASLRRIASDLGPPTPSKMQRRRHAWTRIRRIPSLPPHACPYDLCSFGCLPSTMSPSERRRHANHGREGRSWRGHAAMDFSLRGDPRRPLLDPDNSRFWKTLVEALRGALLYCSHGWALICPFGRQGSNIW